MADNHENKNHDEDKPQISRSESNEERLNTSDNSAKPEEQTDENKFVAGHQSSASSGTEENNQMDTSAQSNDLGQQTRSASSSVFDAFQNSREEDVSYKPDEEEDFLDLVLKNETNKKLIDRLLGCAYGQALGDAYGLSTEFQTSTEVAIDYPDTSKLIPFPDYQLTNHSRRWKRGDWTDDTDQWILILETLTEAQTDQKIENIFAKKLSDWIRYGYPLLGDYGGMGLGANVSQVVHSRNYLDEPLEASEAVWKRSNCQAAPNGAVMRCSASAFYYFDDLEKVKTTAMLLCKTTHFDPRCLASCLAVCLAVTYMLREEFDNNDIEELVERVRKETLGILGDSLSGDHREAFLWHIDQQRTLEQLNLDESRSIGYTFKCLASGFYGLRSTLPFDKTLNDLIRFGGDADTNGAVCGTMYGARHGFKSLPRNWLKAMPFKKWFDKKIIRCFLQKGVVNIEELKR